MCVFVLPICIFSVLAIGALHGVNYYLNEVVYATGILGILLLAFPLIPGKNSVLNFQKNSKSAYFDEERYMHTITI